MYTDTKYVFSVDPDTLEPKGTSMYDPYLFTDPEISTDYIHIDEWQRIRYYKNKQIKFK